jgi:hypothetical protein
MSARAVIERGFMVDNDTNRGSEPHCRGDLMKEQLASGANALDGRLKRYLDAPACHRM